MKWATVPTSPAQTAFLRVLFGFLPLAVIAWRSDVITRSQFLHLPHSAVMSVPTTTFYSCGFVAWTALFPTSIAGLFSGAIPILAFLCAFLFLCRDRPIRPMASGVELGFVGIVLNARPRAGTAGVSPLGVLRILAGTINLCVSFVHVRRFLLPLKRPSLALAPGKPDWRC